MSVVRLKFGSGTPAVSVTFGHYSGSDLSSVSADHVAGTDVRVVAGVLSGDAARMRLDSCVLEQFAGARSRVVVRLVGTAPYAGGAERVVTATHEGSSCPGGDLRLAALATCEALTQAVQGAVTFDLIGVKPVRAFDATILMVAAHVRVDGHCLKVIGAAVDEGDPVLSTARAVLQAVNRLVAPHIASAFQQETPGRK